MAEADGNRTRQRQNLPLNDFEDRAGHQTGYASLDHTTIMASRPRDVLPFELTAETLRDGVRPAAREVALRRAESCDTALHGAVSVPLCRGRRLRREPAHRNGRISGAMSGL
jgi:hypothetical protein